MLVVDDSDRFREYLTRCLREIDGVEVVGTATDGVEALARADELDPDVVMIDIQMPVLDGLEATRRLRRAGTRAKILVMTCHDGDDYQAAARAAGADAFATKARISLRLGHRLQVLTGRAGPEPQERAELDSSR